MSGDAEDAWVRSKGEGSTRDVGPVTCYTDSSLHVIGKHQPVLGGQCLEGTHKRFGPGRAKPPGARAQILQQFVDLPDPARGFHLTPALHRVVHQPYVLERGAAL